MSWRDYLTLLEKYEGDIRAASDEEIARAQLNGSEFSLKIAEIIYQRLQRKNKSLFEPADAY